MYEVYLALAAHRQIQRAESRAGRISETASTGVRLRSLEERFDKLLMICQAQWALLADTTGVTEEQLLDKIREIDLSDGVLDGKVRHPLETCGSCGRTLGRRHASCLYCGEPRAEDPHRV